MTRAAGGEAGIAPTRSQGAPRGPHAPAGVRGEPSDADHRLLRVLVTVVVLWALLGLLYFAKAVLLPIVLALFLALILRLPMVAAERRGVPQALAVVGVVCVLVGLGAVAHRFAVMPAQNLVQDYPVIKQDLRQKLLRLRQSIRPAEEAGGTISEVAEDVSEVVGDNKKEAGVQEVVVKEPSIVSRAAGTLAQGMTTLVTTLILSAFILATPHPFLTLATLPFGQYSTKRHAARTWQSVERRIARYLFFTTMINLGLGTVVGLAMWGLGMGQPAFWGFAAALLNYIPFLGPTIGAAALLAVSIVTFDSIFYALVPPLTYIFINFIEANFVTPTILGNQMKVSSLAIIVALLIWGWLWGIIGVLIAVPSLVVIKAIADKSAHLRVISRMLTRRAHRG